jgi:putative ABC transport system permease protein
MTLWSEFALLGLVAGLVAAIGAETALAVLQTRSSTSRGSLTGVSG